MDTKLLLLSRNSKESRRKVKLKRDLKLYSEKAEKLKAIAHPDRLCIVKGLLENSCNVGTMQECLMLPQSTVSQHLTKLKSANIIEGERNGVEITYRVVDEEIKAVVEVLFSKSFNS